MSAIKNDPRARVPPTGIGLLIRTLRHEANLSQTELGQRAGRSNQCVSWTEQRDKKTTVDTFIALLNALHCKCRLQVIRDGQILNELDFEPTKPL